MDNETTESSDYLYLWRADNPSWAEVIIQIFLWFLSIFTVIGNTLVLLVFARDRLLRAKIANLFILNLAVADLLVGLIFISFYNLYRAPGYWRFGEIAFKFWMVMDFTECYVSVWAIVLISYDRFLLITKGIEYDTYQSFAQCAVLCAVVWVVNFARYSCSLIGYDLFVDTWVDYSEHCDGAVLYKKGHVIYDILASTIVPIILVAYFTITLYVDILKRSRGLPRNWAAVGIESSSVASDNSAYSSQNSVEQNGGIRKQGTKNIFKQRRAAITLLLIIGVSTVCWLPYFTTIFLAVFFQVSLTVRTRIATCYLFYANSAINPLLYVATNPRIRKGIAKIIGLNR